uniref:Uncharacterized protein n=1 Tax=Trichogramma kaykai TaxID=54128 RepID=A0ABD2XQB3_9HYME
MTSHAQKEERYNNENGVSSFSDSGGGESTLDFVARIYTSNLARSSSSSSLMIQHAACPREFWIFMSLRNSDFACRQVIYYFFRP